MTRTTLLAFIFICFLSSCNSKTALDYSQGIVKKEQSITPEITSTESKVRDFMEKEQFDSIAAAGERMEKLVDSKLKEIQNQPAPEVKEAAAFKDASVKYFEYIKSIYTGYKNYGNASTAEARDAELSKLKHAVQLKTDALMMMQRAQRQFAEANGFKLEGN